MGIFIQSYSKDEHIYKTSKGYINGSHTRKTSPQEPPLTRFVNKLDGGLRFNEDGNIFNRFFLKRQNSDYTPS